MAVNISERTKKKNMVILIEVECESKNHWKHIKKIVSNNLLDNKISYRMVDQRYGQLPRTFDLEVKSYKVD
ncbi:hypothetical protein LCGC14_0371920 [marine sediment metagenome]|uniref:Uncharacterized protein n=1 Tax=marine sediment metagenome TaxID=412755 RepID=A0A0F9T571_9ZZZZ